MLTLFQVLIALGIGALTVTGTPCDGRACLIVKLGLGAFVAGFAYWFCFVQTGV